MANETKSTRNNIGKTIVLFDGQDPAESSVMNKGATGLRWEFSNGETRTVLLSEIEEWDAEVRTVAMLHGIKQKLTDEYSGVSKSHPENPAAAAVVLFDEMLDNLTSGIWGEKSGRGGPRLNDILTAYAELIRETGKDVTEEMLAEWRVALKDDAKRAAVAGDPRVAAKVERIRADRAAERAAASAAAAAKATGDISTLM